MADGGQAADDLLMAGMAAGDDSALTEAYARYGALVFGVARRTTRSRAMAEDVVQEVFCALWRNPERFDPARGSLRAYLGVSSHRRAVDALRRDSRRRSREDRHESLEGSVGRYGAEEMDAADLAELVRRAIVRLPEDQRRAVELAYWHGRTHKEIALALGIPEGTAKSRLRLAQAKLGQWLAPAAAPTP